MRARLEEKRRNEQGRSSVHRRYEYLCVIGPDEVRNTMSISNWLYGFVASGFSTFVGQRYPHICLCLKERSDENKDHVNFDEEK